MTVSVLAYNVVTPFMLPAQSSCTQTLHASTCRDSGDDAENKAPEAPKAMKRLKKQVDCCS